MPQFVSRPGAVPLSDQVHTHSGPLSGLARSVSHGPARLGTATSGLAGLPRPWEAGAGQRGMRGT